MPNGVGTGVFKFKSCSISEALEPKCEPLTLKSYIEKEVPKSNKIYLQILADKCTGECSRPNIFECSQRDFQTPIIDSKASQDTVEL